MKVKINCPKSSINGLIVEVLPHNEVLKNIVSSVHCVHNGVHYLFQEDEVEEVEEVTIKCDFNIDGLNNCSKEAEFKYIRNNKPRYLCRECLHKRIDKIDNTEVIIIRLKVGEVNGQ